MAEKGFKRKLTAILSADAVEYSRLMGEDEEATIRTLTAFREAMSNLIKQHRGRVVDTTGDNLLAEFVSAVDAVNCAVEIQRELAERNAELSYERKMHFRIGVNVGDVVEEEDRIYGDGVNIAARVEGLAEAGGICISGRVYDQVENKLDLGYDFLGDQEVKNIAKPVRVYRVLSYPGAAAHRVIKAKRAVGRTWRNVLAATVAVVVLSAAFTIWHFYFRPSVEPASMEKMAFRLPDKPSIAVLPFVNMSGDPEQEYFSDGITEDLITDLSQMSGLFVIARNSTFVYKGKPVKIRQVAEELGVRYVLEGSVRKAGEQVRINTQLIDATTGGHLWAKRYDGRLDDVFGLQDKITRKIVAALAVKLSAGEQEMVTRKETDNIEAYDTFLKGWEHYRRWTPEDFRKAISYFERAIELDPHYGRAYAALASVYFECSIRSWDWPQDLRLSMEACYSHMEKYLQAAMNNPTPLAHQVASKRFIALHYHEAAIAEAERAIALDPNDADGYMAMAYALIYSGKPEEAVDFAKKGMRLDPRNLANYLYTLGVAHFGMEQFQEAASLFERAFKLNPELGQLERAYLAVAYVYLGQEEKARAELDKPEIEVREIYDIYFRYTIARYKNRKDKDRLLDGLRKVGLK
ncbi:MAG: adenylate/guanylate cyclase domain-containing protein [Planctomycetota bacterium]|jgi:TolB-like protein/class 3 adenylate cyclase/Flp pilus assembly protein TadD